jgi:hypothetical protein
VTALFQLQLVYNVGYDRMVIVNEQITIWYVMIVTYICWHLYKETVENYEYFQP